MSRTKAPSGTYWRGNLLWGRLKVKGREIRFSLRTDDAAIAASRYAARREREIAAAHYGDQRPTWEDAFMAWADHIAAAVKPSTVKRYAVSLKQLEPFLQGIFLDEINKAHVSDIIRRRRSTGATNATIRRDLTALSSVLGFAEEEGWREDNPALARLRRLKERRDPIILPGHDHIRRVIDRAPGLFAKLIEAALLTGCRQAELATLERRQIDHQRRQLTLSITKTGRGRVIDLSPEAYALFASLPVNMVTRAVFWHGAGEPYRNVSSRFAAMVKAAHLRAQRQGADFRAFRFHDLRHRFAVDALKNGMPLYDLQQHLGHSSVKVTEIYLAHLTPDEQRRAKYGVARNAAQVQRFGRGEDEAG